MQAKSSALGHTLAITVTTPTRELDSTLYLSELIHPHTSYQVLASPPLLNYDADSLLLAAFPLSVNKLLDITLTFTILQQDKEVNYLGRYLIFDRKLVGIKLSSSKNDGGTKEKEFKKWPCGKVIKYKLPKRVMDYYMNCGDLQDNQGEILVGDFLITMGDLRIGILFESQLQDGEATLYQYKKQGCEIFSVVCDIPRDPIFQASLNTTNARLATKTQSILKRFSRQNNRLVLYCGSRIATPYALFLTNSFILDPQLPEMNINPFYFSEAHSLTLLCNVKVISKDEVYNHRREKITDRFRNQLYVDSQLLSIPVSPGKNQRIYIGKYKQTEATSKQHRQLLKKMKIWYFYTSENKQNPFIISLPLSDGMEDIVNQLFSLSRLISIPISSLLVFFKLNKDIIVSQTIQSQGVRIYQSLQALLADPQFPVLNIYTQNRGQEQYLLTLSDKNYKIRVFYNSIQLRQKPQLRAKNEKMNKMAQFANTVVKNRICGYYKVLKQARSETWRFNLDEQIEAITVYLKNRLRCQVNLHPFFKSILSKSSEEIKQCLFQAQQAIIQPYQSNYSIEAINYSQAQSQQKNTQLEVKDREFFVKMKQFRKSRNLIMKRLQTKCHKCQAYFDKIYIYRCSSCRTEICFICISENFELQPKNRRELIDQLKCLVCKKLCNCSRCLGRQRPDQSLLNSSIFRMENTTQRSITIQDKQEKEDYKQSCTACLIKGRKNTRIKISCSTCENVECLQCYRNQSKRKAPLGPDWQCLTCKPDEQVPALELMPQTDFERTPQPMDIEPNNRNNNKSPASNSKSPLLNTYKQSSQRKASASRSNSPVRNSRASPERSNFNKDGNDNRNGFNNRQNNYRGRGRGGFNRNNNNNSYNNNFNNNNQSQNRPSFDNKRSVSVSRSKSPPRRKNIQQNQSGKVDNKKSPSRSVSKSPPRNPRVNTNNKNNSSPRSVSKSPPRNQKTNNNEKNSPSRSKSPPRNPKTNNNNNKKSSPSRSKSPPRNPKRNDNPNNSRNNERQDSPKNHQNQHNKKRSASRSVSKSPPRKVQQQQKRPVSKSRSKSPPRKQLQKRNSSPSRSRSPQNKPRNSARSNSREKKSNSRSRSRQRQNRRQKQSYQAPKLWNNQRRDNNDNWNNRDRNNNNQSNFNRNDRGGRGRGRGGFNRGGNQGGYNNRDSNNRGYNSYNNNNNDQKDNSQLLNVSQANIEDNFDCDY